MKNTAIAFVRVWKALGVVLIVCAGFLFLCLAAFVPLGYNLRNESGEAVYVIMTVYCFVLASISLPLGILDVVFCNKTIKQLPNITEKKNAISLAILNIIFACPVTGILMLAMPPHQYKGEADGPVEVEAVDKE